jgi:hypothetical protein
MLFQKRAVSAPSGERNSTRQGGSSCQPLKTSSFGNTSTYKNFIATAFSELFDQSAHMNRELRLTIKYFEHIKMELSGLEQDINGEGGYLKPDPKQEIQTRT